MFGNFNETFPIWAWNIMFWRENLSFDHRQYAMGDIVRMNFSGYSLFADFVTGRQDLVGDGY
jgi:hypothetical protein